MAKAREVKTLDKWQLNKLKYVRCFKFRCSNEIQWSKGKKQIQDIIDAMDQIEKDLVNRRLTNEMLRRQQDIMVRLLEEERAQKEQDKDEQRKANQALQQQSKIPPSMQEYIRKKEAGIDDLRPVYPTLIIL